jgi:putative methyltransferase (TIGR04325 family)
MQIARRTIKDVARDWLPPVVQRQLRRSIFHNAQAIRFEGPCESWEEAVKNSSGYAHPEILRRVLAATLCVRSGEAAYERDSVLFNEVYIAWPVTAALMWVAARNQGRLCVLDFGGALGSTYFQNLRFLNAIEHVRWCVVEQKHFVEAGLTHIQDERLVFYESVEACLAKENPSVAILSGVLQYLDDPKNVIDSIASCGIKSVIVDRTPTWSGSHDSIVVQHVPPVIYDACYPMRIFSEKNLLSHLESTWNLIGEFSSIDGGFNAKYGEIEFKGFFLHRPDSIESTRKTY